MYTAVATGTATIASARFPKMKIRPSMTSSSMWPATSRVETDGERDEAA